MTKRGFTVIEMLMSIAILAGLAAISAPVVQSFQNRNDMEVAAGTLAQSLRRAETLARGMDGDATWGVRAQSGSLIIFRGASYALRNPSFDETFSIPGSITVSGNGEYVFAKLTGFPQATGVTTLTSLNNETRTINVNAKGMVDY